MEAFASCKTKKSRTRSSAAPAADAEARAAAGASPPASEPVEASSSGTTTTLSPAQLPAVGPAASTGGDPVDRLPAALAQRVFLLLPAHDRMRCREVSRAWRAALADRGCWRILRFSSCDLPLFRGEPDRLEDFILAASRAAGGAAAEIDARGVQCDHLAHIFLREAAEANGGSLRVLRVSGTARFLATGERTYLEPITYWLGSGKLPRIEELEADVRAATVAEASQLLDDARPPDGRFKALRIRSLSISPYGMSVKEYKTPELQRVAESLAEFLRTAAPGHPSLTGLTLGHLPLLHPGVIDAVADAAVACRLESLDLEGPYINHTCLPALSQALRCGRLRSLVLDDDTDSSNDGRAGTLDGPRSTHDDFCAALRGSRLESLALRNLRLWADPDNGRALLAALTAHPTLRSLDISWNKEAGNAASNAAAAAEAIAALLEANAPELKSLCINACGLTADHLERILGALCGNAHLTTMLCRQLPDGAAAGGGFDEAFAYKVVMPLVQANATLQTLKWDGDFCGRAGEEIDLNMEVRSATKVVAA